MSVPVAQLNELEIPRYVVVEGPIGVGKTTLARRLADTFGHPLLLEPAADNPFLDRFYRDSGRHALQTQLFFLLHRLRQLADLGDGDLFSPQIVADFLLQKDRLFAELTLDADEFALYEQIHDKLAITVPPPDLVVYLQAPVRVLGERIRRRGVPAEQRIDSGYLSSIIDAYARFFHFYDDSPLLIVNAAEIDLASNDAHFVALVERIANMTGTRQFFNPHPMLL
jgi:deoxyadenosine/deoxycytidine kinase